jgi:hypothetical protein
LWPAEPHTIPSSASAEEAAFMQISRTALAQTAIVLLKPPAQD